MLGIGMLMLTARGIGIDSAVTSYKTKKRADEYRDKGGFLQFPPYHYHMMLMDDYERDWNGERTKFPKEYHAYFEKNQNARFVYEIALAYQQEAREEYKPYGVYTYDRYKFDPFSRFHYMYDDKIKIFNEEGIYYGG